jgi:hypothetical protein
MCHLTHNLFLFYLALYTRVSLSYNTHFHYFCLLCGHVMSHNTNSYLIVPHLWMCHLKHNLFLIYLALYIRVSLSYIVIISCWLCGHVMTHNTNLHLIMPRLWLCHLTHNLFSFYLALIMKVSLSHNSNFYCFLLTLWMGHVTQH